MKKKFSMIELVNKVSKLNEGSYEDGNKAIYVTESKKLDKYTVTPKEVLIVDNDEEYTFIIDENSSYKTSVSYNNKNENISIIQYPFGEYENINLKFKKDNIDYSFSEYIISASNLNGRYVIHNNIISKIIDNNEKIKLGYDINDKKIYVYIRKKNKHHIREYIKINYTDDILTMINNFNNLTIDYKRKIEELNNANLDEIIDIPVFNTNIEKEIEDLTFMANIYCENRDKLNILNNNELLIKLNDFVSSVQLSLDDKYIHDLIKDVNELDLKNIDNLKILKKNIKKIIKLRAKKEKKLIMK